MMGSDEVVGSFYQLSTDGGKTWGDPSDDWVGNSILLDPSDNLTLAFESGQAVGKDDVFFVKASAAGYYRGDGESLSLPIAPGSTASYGTPGEGLFVPKDGKEVDLFQVLSDLIDAMENDDADGVDALLGSLNSAREQLELGTSLCATKQSRLEMAKKSLDRLDRNMTDIAANTENANVTELAMLISMKETALQSTYALASRLGDHSILNFLK
jgi:flagellin-like hook-associated protein FlgL